MKNWWSILACTAVVAGGTAVALTPTATLAAALTHPLVAERAGVVVREVTIEGAHLLRWAASATAVAWFVLPILVWRLSTPSPKLGRSPPAPRLWWWILCAAAAVGLALRLARLTESLWFDEIAALLDYAQYGAGPVIGTYFSQSNHVFHTLLTSWMISLTDGVSEPILRMPALLGGIGSIPAMWWLGRESSMRTADPTARPNELPFLCAGAAALMPIMVLESVEARGYSLMILFAALSSAALLRGLRTGGVFAFVGYALFAALGVWSHLVFVALPLGHAIVLAARIRKPNSHAGVLAVCLAAITAFALLAPLLPDLLQRRDEFRALDGNEPTLISREGLAVLLGLGGSWWMDGVLWLPFVLLGIAGALLDRSRRLPVALALAGLPLLLVVVSFGGSWMYARFAVFTLPGAILAGAYCIADLARARSKAPITARVPHGLLIAGSVLAFAWIDRALSLPAKQPIRDALAYIEAQAESRGDVAAAGLHDNVVAYYGVIANREILDAGYGGSRMNGLSPSVEWVIVIYPHCLDATARAELASKWRLSKTIPGWVDWGKGEVQVYSREPR